MVGIRRLVGVEPREVTPPLLAAVEHVTAGLCAVAEPQESLPLGWKRIVDGPLAMAGEADHP